MLDSTTGKPLAEITGMCKRYGDFSALHDINLTVVEGEKIMVCGLSDSGKSTMIRCINQFEAHQKGAIMVDGTEVTPGMKNIEFVRCEVEMVFQSFNLFPHMTILDNLILGPMRNRGVSRKEATDCGSGGQIPAATVGRSAAACGDCPIVVHETQGDAQRTDLGAGS